MDFGAEAIYLRAAMTTVATVTALHESPARALVRTLEEDELLWAFACDLSETSPGVWQVQVYFPEGPTALESSALERLGNFAFARLADTNWVAKALEALAPVRAGPFVVHGSHDRAKLRANDIGIEIEAGLAFGTGHHGTTAGCLIAIDRVAKERTIRSALDVGTGSGVLAIALAKRAKAHVVASDIDPVATGVARDNVRLNHVAALVRTLTATGLNHAAIEAHTPYDLIVANILASPLVAMAPAIRRSLAPGGSVILSGLLVEQERRVASMYRAAGIVREASIHRDEWATLILRG
jgi:ribosomal protein L11 methyltransferase